MLVCPFLDGGVHVSLDLNAVVTEGRVVERAEDVVDYLIDWDARIFPSVQDAPIEMC